MGQWIGADCLGSYVTIDIQPGEHHLCANVQGEKESPVFTTALNALSAEAGKTYYFRATLFIRLDMESGFIWSHRFG